VHGATKTAQESEKSELWFVQIEQVGKGGLPPLPQLNSNCEL